MAAQGLGFDIGAALTGGDIDREGARLEGLDLGTKINARKASTENALAQARLRVDEADARETLADELDLGGNKAIAAAVRAGANPEQITGAQLDQQRFGGIEDLPNSLSGDSPLAGAITAGVNPEQFTGALLDQQQFSNRESIADTTLPFEQRQASAQAVEGKVVDPFQITGGLFADVFNPGANPELAPTNPLDDEADRALAEQRRAAGALSDEKRLHPERFKSLTTVNIGGQGLGDQILQDIGESTIPGDIKPEAATGIAGAAFSAGNILFDVANVNLPFPDTEEAGNALNDLHKRTMIVGQQSVPGRPSNYLMEQLATFGVTPNDVFRSDQRSLARMQQTSRYLGGEIDRLRRILNAGRLTPTKIAASEDALRNLAALKQDYDVVTSRFNRDEETETEGLPEGWSVTTTGG